MNNLLTRISIQLEGNKHSSFSSDEGGGTKKMFEKISDLGKSEYLGLKTLKVGQTFTFNNRNFKVTNIDLTHHNTNQFGDGDEESLDIHIIVIES